MNDEVRAEVIMDLRHKGWICARIGRQVGLSANGVKYALHRVSQPGRATTSNARRRSTTPRAPEVR
jgi:hypothetical protein